MNYSGLYIARMDAVSVSAARTLVQINNAATTTLEIIRMVITASTTTSAALDVLVKRVTTAGTGTSFTAIELRPIDSAFGGTCTTNHTAEGTAGDTILREYFNALNGWLYLPVPEERIVIPPSERFALAFGAAPAATTFSAAITFGTRG